MVFGLVSYDEDSSSSSDATSAPNVQLDKSLRFTVAQNRCLDRLIFDRRALPDGFQLQGLAVLFQQVAFQLVPEPVILNAPEPIIINIQHLAEANSKQNNAAQPTSMEIVP